MYDLEVSVQGHRLVLPFPGHMMTSDNIQVDRIHFTFDNNWTGYTCTALFWGYDTDTPYSVQLTNGYAVIPAEVLADKGKIYFGVFGIKGNSRITSNTVTTTCDKCGAYGNTEPYIRQYRRVGTITEQAFDVVAVKRVISGNVRNITITCVRVGAPAMDNIDVPYTEGDFDFTSTLETRQVTRSFPYQTGGD